MTTWAALLVLFFIQAVEGYATGAGFTPMSITGLALVALGLITYVSLDGSTGSDLFGVGATSIAVTKSVSLIAYVAGIVTLAISSFTTTESPLLALLNIGVGGFAFFGAIHSAKPGGA